MSKFGDSKRFLDRVLHQEKRLKQCSTVAFSALSASNAVAILEHQSVWHLAAIVIRESQLSVDGQLFSTSYLKLRHSSATFPSGSTPLQNVSSSRMDSSTQSDARWPTIFAIKKRFRNNRDVTNFAFGPSDRNGNFLFRHFKFFSVFHE